MRSLLVLLHILTWHQKANVNIGCACIPVSACRHKSLVLSSGNTSFSHTSLHLILTKLAHSKRYLDHYSGTDNGGVRGHDGVTGVKKVIFTKKASSPTEYLALMRDLCI